MTGRVLEWRVSSDLPRIEEDGLLVDDGTVWLWVGVGGGGHGSDVAGTFRAGDVDVARARDLVARLRSGAASAEMPPGHLSVDVTADSSTTTIDVADPADPVEADLVAVLSELATAAMHEPLAVVRLTVEAKRFPPEMNLPSRLVFRLDGEGSMATRWRLDAEGFGVRWLDADGHELAWASLDRPPTGLVDAEANLIDGLFGDAEVPAGAAVALAITAPEPPPGTASVEGSMTGAFARVEDDGSLGPTDSPYELRSPPTPW
jgi:hypothetical protein